MIRKTSAFCLMVDEKELMPDLRAPAEACGGSREHHLQLQMTIQGQKWGRMLFLTSGTGGHVRNLLE
jgi:hypothetical protein